MLNKTFNAIFKPQFYQLELIELFNGSKHEFDLNFTTQSNKIRKAKVCTRGDELPTSQLISIFMTVCSLNDDKINY